MELDRAIGVLSRWAEVERKFAAEMQARNPLVSGSHAHRFEAIDTLLANLADLTRLAREVETLRRERDRLIEMWPRNIESVVYDPPNDDGKYYIGSQYLVFPSRTEAVRSVAKLDTGGGDDGS